MASNNLNLKTVSPKNPYAPRKALCFYPIGFVEATSLNKTISLVATDPRLHQHNQ